MYPRTLFDFPSEEDSAPTASGNVWEEVFLSNFYLFGISPFVIDLKHIAGEGLEDLIKMKRWTDQIATASGAFSLSIVFQFDKNRLQPIRLRK
jgi:hypothetical protein